MLCSAAALLAGDLVWQGGGKKKEFVDELSWAEVWGLWVLESNSFNMWAILGTLVVRPPPPPAPPPPCAPLGCALSALGPSAVLLGFNCLCMTSACSPSVSSSYSSS